MTLPALEPVAATLQLPPESGQPDDPNMTLPEPLCDQDTEPVGLEPVTVAVHVLNPPTAMVAGEHTTAVLEAELAVVVVVVDVLVGVVAELLAEALAAVAGDTASANISP